MIGWNDFSFSSCGSYEKYIAISLWTNNHICRNEWSVEVRHFVADVLTVQLYYGYNWVYRRKFLNITISISEISCLHTKYITEFLHQMHIYRLICLHTFINFHYNVIPHFDAFSETLFWFIPHQPFSCVLKQHMFTYTMHSLWLKRQ